MAEKKYDVIIVGSGATGGIAAKELTEKGIKVLVLEAGPYLKEELFHQKGSGFKNIGSMPRIIAAIKGQFLQARASFYAPEKSFLFVNDFKDRYTWSKDFFLWIRSKNVGGRFQSWGRVALRMSDYAFKSKTKEGVGVDWPISYEDLVSYYEKIEKFLGVVGTEDHIEFVPDGKYIKKAGLSTAEREMKKTIEAKWPDRKVIPWRYVQKNATPVDDNQNRTTAPLAAAKATGLMELRANAIVKKVKTDSTTGEATGVVYLDRDTKKEYEVEANRIMLCASAIESVRLLFNSASAKHPNGLGNSSGLLGKYFMDQVPSLVFGTIPNMEGGELVDGTNFGDNHGGIYIPRFQNLKKTTHPTFKGGFNIQGIAGRMPAPGNSVFGFMGHGEMLPYKDNYITVNPKKKDAWGIPVANVNIELKKNERNLVKAQLETTKEMVREMGYTIDFAMNILGLDKDGKLLPNSNWFERLMFKLNWRKSMALGAAIHECGGARMGTDPKESVLNAHNQVWDAPNVYVTDPSCFPTNGSCGPTLTAMAITAKACEFIANEIKK